MNQKYDHDHKTLRGRGCNHRARQFQTRAHRPVSIIPDQQPRRPWETLIQNLDDYSNVGVHVRRHNLTRVNLRSP